MKTITVTATVAAWLPNYHRPDELMGALDRRDSVRAVSILHFYGDLDQEWFGAAVRVGEADITLRLLPRDEQTRMAVEALNKKLEQLRAAYLTAQQEIYEQITNLQALTNEVEA